jgi:hypothetical protein
MTRSAAAGLMLLTILLIGGDGPASAQYGRNGQLHIVKDCETWSGIPGSTYCEITWSNIPQLPPGTRIYYNQITDGPTAGPGFLDSNIFVYVNNRRWAVGRCTTRNDDKEPGLCTLSDGVGSLAGLSARIEVTKQSGGSGYLYAWNGTYRFEPIWGR